MQNDIELVRFIRAPKDRIWKAITDPQQITAYHIAGMQAQALPEGGHELLRPDDGSTFIRQALIKEKTGSRFEVSFEPTWVDPPVSDEQKSTVVFELEEEGQYCKLSLTQSNCASMGIGDNWDRFLDSMKSFVETGAGLKSET